MNFAGAFLDGSLAKPNWNWKAALFLNTQAGLVDFLAENVKIKLNSILRKFVRPANPLIS